MTIRDKTKKNEDESFRTQDFQLYVLLDRARSIISRSRELELAQYGLSPEQAAVLHVLQSMGGSATIAELANTLVRQYNTATTIVNRMANLGLVRKIKPQESKKFTVTITEQAQNIYENVSFNSLEMVFSCLDSEQKKQLVINLEELIKKGRDILGIDFKPPFLR